MKRIGFVLAVALVLLGCSNPFLNDTASNAGTDSAAPYTYTFKNNSSATVTISNVINAFASFSLASGNSKTVGLDYEASYDIEPNGRVQWSETGTSDKTITISDGPAFEYTFQNESSLPVTLTPLSQASFSTTTVPASGTAIVTIYGTDSFPAFTMGSASQSTAKFGARPTDTHSFTIRQYMNLVEYRLSGTAANVNVTLNNSAEEQNSMIR